ncbi:MAG: hypothetical protein ACR2PK_02030, partial [Acidimicrobiales bacterium]
MLTCTPKDSSTVRSRHQPLWDREGVPNSAGPLVGGGAPGWREGCEGVQRVGREEANYFISHFAGDSELRFGPDELPPLTDIGFWSLTIHDPDMLVRPNEYDSY